MKKGFTYEERAEVLGHYDRMIEAAKSFVPTEAALHTKMLVSARESWSGSDCYLCKTYIRKGFSCKQCPMSSVDKGLCYVEDSLHRRVANAETWADWIIAAQALRDAVATAPPRSAFLRLIRAIAGALFGYGSRSIERYKQQTDTAN